MRVRRRAAGAALMVALVAGLVAGTLHAAWYLVRRFVMHRMTFDGADVVWTAPLSYTLLLAILGLPLAVVGALAPGRASWRLAVGCCVGLAAWSVLLLARVLHPLASLSLAIGLAVQLMTRADQDRWMPRLRRVAAGLALFAVLGAGAARGIPVLREHLEVRALPPARHGAPNVLLVVVDMERAEELGLYGYGRPTSPALDRRASESTVFEWAIAPSPWTLPSHASMFTGLPPGTLTARWLRPLRDTVPTLATVLRDRGYRTAGFSANMHYATEESGLDRGFSHFESHLVSPLEIVRLATPWQTKTAGRLFKSGSWRQRLRALRHPDLSINLFPTVDFLRADRISADFLRWQAAAGNRPFFAFLNLYEVHELSAPEAFLRRFGDARRQDRYDAAVAFVDSVVGAMLDTLDRRGVLDRTIVVITSDHGELFGEHDVRGHGNSLYMPLLRVPLVIRYPGVVPSGRTVPGTVSTRNIAATILDLADVRDAALPGVSLRSRWKSGLAADLAVADVEQTTIRISPGPARLGAMRSIVDDEWHYIVGAAGEELYAYRSDLGELIERSGEGASAPVLARLRAALAAVPSWY